LTSLDLSGKTFHPDPLVYYAAAVEGSANREKALAFVNWLAGDAQPIFKRFAYDPPLGATALHA
jgi:ABC-type molybdate transport system substrate-binding protein